MFAQAREHAAKWRRLARRIFPHPYPYILLLFVSTRITLTIIGVVSRTMLEPLLGKWYLWRYSKPLWLDIWSVWDSGWYLDIAQYGYSATTHSLLPKYIEPGQLNYAFFPVYPMLMRGLGWLIGDYPVAGIIISNVSLLVASIFLYKLVDLSDGRRTAGRAVRCLMLFPTGFILSGLFTEATFLALALMCFYFARKGNWLAVGIAGFFLALSRTVGVLVAVPLLYEYLKARSFNPLRIRPGILWLGLIPLGLGLFMAFNYHLTGDWLAFVHVQRAWQRKLINPLSALKDGLVSPVMCVMFSAWFVLVALAMATIFCRRIGLSYWVLTMLLILIPLSNSLPHMSQMGTMPRYTMAAFPLFILLARLTRNPRLDYAMSAFLAGLQGFLMVFWSVGSPLVI